MYIITGFGRSGTSFISEIFQNAGYKMGQYRKEVDAGFENHAVCQINASLGFSAVLNNDIINKMRNISNNNKIVKDPRFSITLGSWIEAGIKIDNIFWCSRDYYDILISSKKSSAGQMQMFRGFTMQSTIPIMTAIENAIFDLCDRSNINIDVIHFPTSLQNFNEVLCLNKVINNEEKLKELWKKTIRLPKD